ncbi:helix-turn-helix domain-containing protein [Pedobacter miscanthi]|uniref:HTH cro/C1-type domain-containing protein n=1 Tax=Pedobacter miscanthi TaxID=2259170 RepID=A0A366KNW8_9SPHI|nr:helix-turn-helix transcriptional regulator [Pedobacter miscanthi]RBQ02814.1 hypothetical protein DRW42_24500 [Pedobacter miscanthi]
MQNGAKKKGGQIKGGKKRRNEQGIITLAHNVKKYRKQKGLTIAELANKLDLDYSQISRIERGVVNATVSMIFDISDFFEISPQMLLEEFKPDKD